MMEMDRERQKKLPPTDFQKETQHQNETLLTKAKEMIDEQEDDVKHMNQMMLYSKVVTVRDKQLEEQKRLEVKIFKINQILARMDRRAKTS